MSDKNEFLELMKESSNPFKVPEGYLEGVEDLIMSKIGVSEAGADAAGAAVAAVAAVAEEPRGWRAVVKPIIYMAAMFGVIFGMGYGVMALTHTSERLPAAVVGPGESRIAEVDNGFLDASFIEFLDVASLDSDSASQEPLSDDEIVSYLTNELSINELASYLAQE